MKNKEPVKKYLNCDASVLRQLHDITARACFDFGRIKCLTLRDYKSKKR